jgi:microcystin-dependent protein
MTLYKWSQTSASDATADPTINWQEGQAPSTVNDSARAMMAATAKYRDDISGAIVTSGSSTAYTVSSYQVFDSLVHLSGQMIAFTPHVTNAATVTLSVDSLTAKPLRTAPGVELLAGTIIQGTPYVATYNNSDGAFYLQGFFGNPYNVPFLSGMDFWDTIAPNSLFIFPAGQAISRTAYAAAFARWGTTYGVGDGSTTFNVPDKTGRVSAMQEASVSRLTPTYFGGNSTVLGAVGGAESLNLGLTNLPGGITSANVSTINLAVATNNTNIPTGTITSSGAAGGGNSQFAGIAVVGVQGSSGVLGAGAVPVVSNNTGGNPHRTVQPTIVCNYIIRII